MPFYLALGLLFWFVGWPFLMYFVMRLNVRETQTSEVSYEDVAILPHLDDGGVRLSIDMGGTELVLNDKQSRDLINRLQKTHMTVQTMDAARTLG